MFPAGLQDMARFRQDLFGRVVIDVSARHEMGLQRRGFASANVERGFRHGARRQWQHLRGTLLQGNPWPVGREFLNDIFRRSQNPLP